MKTTAFPLLLLLFTGSLSAQEQPKDPFVKDKKPAVSGTAAAEAAPKNILCLVETITLPDTVYLAWLDSPADREKLYDRAQEAVQAGTAILDSCHFLPSKSGTRSVLEGAEELIYPTEWDAPDSTGFQYPTAWETRHLGDTWEFECVQAEKEGPLNMSHQFSRTRLEGVRRIKADATLPGVPWFEFCEQQSPAACDMIPGVPSLIATLTQQPAKPGLITLVFGTLKVALLSPPPQPAPKNRRNVHLTARVISVDRMKGAALLKKHWLKDAACLAELNEMIAAKQAVLEHVSTVVTRSGARSLHQSGISKTYGVEFTSPLEGAPGKTGPGGVVSEPSRGLMAGTKSADSRMLGYNWEVEPVVNEEGTFGDVTLSFNLIRSEAPLKDKEWNEHYPEMPLFTSQKITTGIVLPVNSTALFGTLTPPGDTGVNGRKDENRVWLVFVDMHLE